VGERELVGHDDRVTGLSLRADGRVALSGGADRQLLLWDPDSAEVRRTLPAAERPVTAVALAWTVGGRSPRGDEPVAVWELPRGERLATLPATSARPLRDDRRRGSARGDRRRRPDGADLDIETGACRRCSGATSAACSASPSRRTAARWRAAPRTAACCSGRSTAAPACAASPATASRCWRRRLARRPLPADRRRDHTARYWDLATGRCLRVLEGHRETVTAVAFLPDGRFAATAGIEGTVRLYDIRSRDCLRSFAAHVGAPAPSRSASTVTTC